MIDPSFSCGLHEKRPLSSENGLDYLLSILSQRHQLTTTMTLIWISEFNFDVLIAPELGYKDTKICLIRSNEGFPPLEGIEPSESVIWLLLWGWKSKIWLPIHVGI